MHQCWVEVDLDVLANNIKQIKNNINAHTEHIMVVKSDAYGHGLIPVVKTAILNGVKWFAVAYISEALAVRQISNEANILFIGVADPSEVTILAKNRITALIVDFEQGIALSNAAKALNLKIPVHIKIDTGMGRLGLFWQESIDAIKKLLNYERKDKNITDAGIDIQGLCSHFASVELDDPQSACNQAERFFEISKQAELIINKKLFKHISSSRAFLYHKEWDLDGVRPGIIAYGYGANDVKSRVNTKPILQWKGYVMQVRTVPAGFAIGYDSTYVTADKTQIAVLGCGYSDGYLRSLSNKGKVLINGQRYPVVGRVSMNWITVDLGLNSNVKRVDQVVFLGEQGRESIWANELAAICDTIPYEILTGISARVERRYITHPTQGNQSESRRAL